MYVNVWGEGKVHVSVSLRQYIKKLMCNIIHKDVVKTVNGNVGVSKRHIRKSECIFEENVLSQ